MGRSRNGSSKTGGQSRNAGGVARPRGAARGTAAALALAMVVLALPAHALPKDPIVPPIDDIEVPFDPPAGGFKWSVPSRFGARYDGLVDFHWNQATGPLRWGTEADREKYDPAHVHPDTYPMDFDACPTPEERDLADSRSPTANTYAWVVDGEDRGAHTTCYLHHEFDEQGTYDVTLTITGDEDVAGTFAQQVYVKDFLIVSVGDSYASGEGNPDVPQIIGGGWHNDLMVLSEARWVDRRCHRSANSASAQAARRLEAADPKTSVTFLSFACSGATIDRAYNDGGDPFDPYAPGDRAKPTGSGVLGTYRGAEPPDPTRYDDHVPSQIDQLVATVGDRRIDSLTMSAGGNDIGFGPIASVCVLFADCRDHRVYGALAEGPRPLYQRFGQDLGRMEGRYEALDAALRDPANGLDIAETFITEYPDPTKDETGAQCHEMLEDTIKPFFWGAIPFHIVGSEVDFAAGEVLPGLNGAVRDAATAHGWRYVDGIAAAYDGHGYCSSDSWIRRAVDSTRLQGPYYIYDRHNPFEYGPFPPDTSATKGTLHPTTRGLQAVADRLVEEMRPALYASVPAPPATAAFAATAVAGDERAIEGDNGWLTGACLTTSPTTCTSDHTVLTVEATDSVQIMGAAVSLNGEQVACEEPWCTATRPDDGRYRWTLRLGEGLHQLDFTVSGPDGQVASYSKEVKVDLTDPTASATVDPEEPASGWFTTPVEVALGGDDAGAGIATLESRVDGGPFVTGPHGQSVVDLDTDGVHTVEYRAVDWAGRRSALQSVTVHVDQTAPAIDCEEPDGAWHTADVTLACTAADEGSGLADAADATLVLATDVPDGTETADASTDSTRVCDVAGNCATAGPVGGNKVDRKAPTISIGAPAEGAEYLLGQSLPSDFRCADGGSGLATCLGSVADGEAIDTATVGPKTFRVDASDAAGNSSSMSVDYEVHYDFSGFRAPVDSPPATNEVRGGSVVPVKFSLSGDQGLAIFATGSPRSQRVACDSSSQVFEVEETVTAGSSGLSYDATVDQYVYRWKTNKAWKNTCRRLWLEFDDGTSYHASFTFK